MARTPPLAQTKPGFGILYLPLGGSGGRPTEENNAADAAAAYDHLIGRGIPAEKIVAYGELLGSGQAVRLAAERPVATVVLEAPLTSTVDVAQKTYFWLPLGLVITDTYDNQRNIRAVTAPVLVLHGEPRWKWAGGSNAPPPSRSKSSCSPRGPIPICSTMARGRKREPFLFCWADSAFWRGSLGPHEMGSH